MDGGKAVLPADRVRGKSSQAERRNKREKRGSENRDLQCDDSFRGETLWDNACSTLGSSCIEDADGIWNKEQASSESFNQVES